MLLGVGAASTAYAAGPSESPQATTQQALAQSDRWEGAGDTWKVRTQDGTAYLTNSWFQDNDNSWYMLGADGTMYSGLVTDQSTGKSYLLNTNHDGTFGKMLTQDGVYTINGAQVHLTFNQSHDGSYGAITTGLSATRSTGVHETHLPSIPTDSTQGIPTNTTPAQGNTPSVNNGIPSNESQGYYSKSFEDSLKNKPSGGIIDGGTGETWIQG